MNTNKFIIGGIVGGVVSFLVGNFIFLFLFKTFFDENSFPIDVNAVKWVFGVLSSLCWGFTFAYILEKAKATTMSTAVVTGVIAAVLIEATFDFNFYSVGMVYKNLTIIAVDVALTGVAAAAICAAITLVNGMGKKAA